MTKITPVLILLPVFFILSCMPKHTYLNKDVNPKSKLAVIVGETKYGTENAVYAGNFTTALASGSRLSVLSQKQVKSVLGSYPERIKGPYKVFGMDEPEVDYTLHDMDTLALIAQKLKVQYLYVFWIPSAVRQTTGDPNSKRASEITAYWYVGELIEFPSRRIIAQGHREMAFISKGPVISIGGGDAPRSIEDMCKLHSELAVKDIIENTGIGK